MDEEVEFIYNEAICFGASPSYPLQVVFSKIRPTVLISKPSASAPAEWTGLTIRKGPLSKAEALTFSLCQALNGLLGEPQIRHQVVRMTCDPALNFPNCSRNFMPTGYFILMENLAERSGLSPNDAVPLQACSVKQNDKSPWIGKSIVDLSQWSRFIQPADYKSCSIPVLRALLLRFVLGFRNLTTHNILCLPSGEVFNVSVESISNGSDQLPFGKYLRYLQNQRGVLSAAQAWPEREQTIAAWREKLLGQEALDLFLHPTYRQIFSSDLQATDALNDIRRRIDILATQYAVFCSTIVLEKDISQSTQDTWSAAWPHIPVTAFRFRGRKRSRDSKDVCTALLQSSDADEHETSSDVSEEYCPPKRRKRR